MAKKGSSKIDEKVCIHCGEKVSSNETICPSCGLPVSSSEVEDNSIVDKKPAKSGKNLNAIMPIIIIGVIVLIAIIVAWWLTAGNKLLSTKTKVPVSESHMSQEEIKEKFAQDIKDPNDAKNLEYAVEGDDIVKVSYEKVVDKNNNVIMSFVMRKAKSTEDIERSIGLSDSKGNDVVFASETPIKMIVKCEDDTEVNVDSYVALDENGTEMKYMRATWYDNDNYYSMVTDNLSTREDFLQEVNRVIIANHETF